MRGRVRDYGGGDWQGVPTMASVAMFLYWWHCRVLKKPKSFSRVVREHRLEVTRFTEREIGWMKWWERPPTVWRSEEIARNLLAKRYQRALERKNKKLIELKETKNEYEQSITDEDRDDEVLP